MWLLFVIVSTPGLFAQPTGTFGAAFDAPWKAAPRASERAGTRARAQVAWTALPVVTSGPEQCWRLAAPGAFFLGGLNVRTVRESPEVRQAMQELSAAIPAASIAEWQRWLDDIDEVWIAAEGSRDPQPLLLLRGRFGGRHWRERFPASALPGAAADALLMGSNAAVLAAKRRLLAVGAPSALAEKARRVASGQDVWLVAQGPELGNAAAAAGKAPEIVSHLRGFAFGLGLRDPLVAHLTLDADSAASATQLLGWLRTSIADAGVPKELESSVEVRQEAESLQVRLSLPAAKAQALVAERNRRPSRTTPGKVVIHGMEGGTREVPYTPAQP